MKWINHDRFNGTDLRDGHSPSVRVCSLAPPFSNNDTLAYRLTWNFVSNEIIERNTLNLIHSVDPFGCITQPRANFHLDTEYVNNNNFFGHFTQGQDDLFHFNFLLSLNHNREAARERVRMWFNRNRNSINCYDVACGKKWWISVFFLLF